MKSCAIVGAGISGLLAAGELSRAGWKVTVFDKGRGIGGRMATRRIGEAVCDHGAQFFTARDPRFRESVSLWVSMGLVKEWGRGFGGSGDPEEACYRGLPSMTAVPKHLAKALDVRKQHRVVRIVRQEQQWLLDFDSGQDPFTCDALVVTAPVPQSLALLDSGGIRIASDLRRRLDALQYDACLAVMAVLDGPSGIPAPGGMPIRQGPLAWIADNAAKGISSASAVTLHARADFSEHHWDDKERGHQLLLEAAKPFIGATIVESQVHGWRYARPRQLFGAAYAVISRSPLLLVAGDAFGGPRIEDAALSGLAAAHGVAGQAV